MKNIPYLLPPSIKVNVFAPDAYETRVANLMLDTSEIDRARVILIGVPFDGAIPLGRAGCRFGPKVIREAMSTKISYNADFDVDLGEGFTIVDAGDVDIINTNSAETHKRIESVMTNLLGYSGVPVMLGGDHSISYCGAKAVCNRTKGHVGVIVIDTHYDVRVSHHGEMSSGTPFRRMVEETEGKIRAQNLVEIGIHSFYNSGVYHKYVKEKGFRIFTAMNVHENGIDSILKQAFEYAKDGTDAIYVSVDVDGLDQTIAPGTNVPCIGGLTGPQIEKAAFELGKDSAVKAFDFVEVSPPLDVNNLTAQTAAEVVLDFMAGIYRRK
jgi:formimidoylglutamase